MIVMGLITKFCDFGHPRIGSAISDIISSNPNNCSKLCAELEERKN
jgi:hypothetical protein